MVEEGSLAGSTESRMMALSCRQYAAVLWASGCALMGYGTASVCLQFFRAIIMQASGHKTGSGAPASAQDIALDRKERLRRLAIETVDLSKDPYLHRNHVGKIECRLCLTLHLNEASYLTHTQGRKHQTNLARRAAKEQSLGAMGLSMSHTTMAEAEVDPRLAAAKSTAVPSVGRPGYRVTKLRDPKTKQFGLRFELDYAQILAGEKPRHKFVPSWEQKVETPDADYQYIVFAANPYGTIGFKIPAAEIDQNHNLEYWDTGNAMYLVQFLFSRNQCDP